MRRLLETPAALPVSVAELAAHLRITGSDDDAELKRCLRDAVAHIQESTGLQLVAAKWRYYRDRFPGNEWRLRPWPLLSVSLLTYLDGDGDRQTLDSADYSVAVSWSPGRVRPAYGVSWPAVRQIAESVQCDVFAGCAVPITSVDTATDKLTLGVFVPANDTPIWLTTDTTLPTGLSSDTTYYVVNRDASAKTIQLATSAGGSAVNITGAGSGQSWLHAAQDDVWHAARRAVLVLAAHWWEHREEQVDGQQLRSISHGVQRTLDVLHQGDDFDRDCDE